MCGRRLAVKHYVWHGDDGGRVQGSKAQSAVPYVHAKLIRIEVRGKEGEPIRPSIEPCSFRGLSIGRVW